MEYSSSWTAGPDLHQPCTRGGWLQQPASGHCSRSWITCPCLPPGFSHPVAWSRSGSRPHASERAAHRPDHAEAMPDRLVRVVSPFRARALPPKYMRRALHQPAQKILLARRAGARPSGSWVCVFVGPWAWTAGVRGGVHLQLDGLTSASASSPCVGVGHATLVTIYAR